MASLGHGELTRNKSLTIKPVTKQIVDGRYKCYACVCHALNSVRPSDAYHQPRPKLVQIMACRLDGAKPLFEPMLILWLGPLGTNFSEILIEIHFNRKSNIFIQENAFQNVVCEMSDILSRF